MVVFIVIKTYAYFIFKLMRKK